MLRFIFPRGGATAVAAATLAVAAVSARSAVINYGSLSSNGVTLSNIQEINSDGFTDTVGGNTVGHFGALTFVNGVLASTPDAYTISTSGGATQTSATLTDRLTFDLTLPTAVNPMFIVNEAGAFTGLNGGVGILAPTVLVETPDTHLPLSSVTATLSPHASPFVGPDPTTTVINWSGTASANANGLTSFHIEISNDLSVVAPTATAGLISFAQLEKRSFSVGFCPNCATSGGGSGIPEPASLGFLSVGLTALLLRRRART